MGECEGEIDGRKERKRKRDEGGNRCTGLRCPRLDCPPAC